jgi:hypothetical protein
MRASTAERKRKRRDNLYWRQGGRCFYCAETMENGPYPAQMPPGGPSPRLCTVENLIDRNDPRRGTIPGRWVAACYECNFTRGVESRISRLQQKEAAE